MDTSFILLVIVQIILMILLYTFIYMFLLNKLSIDYEKRFSSYSLTSMKDEKISLFEKLYNLLWNIIKKISNILNKSEILRKYSKKFNKYISYNELNNRTGMDFISIKFIISLVIGLLYIISTLIRFNFDYMLLIILMIISFFSVDIYYTFSYKNRRKRIENDLLSAIIIMNNAFVSGMNIMQAVNIVESELSGDIKEEFRKINIDIKYGLSLETVFERFYNRVKIEDIKYISSSLSLINKTGGNIVRVFSSIERNFYDKKKIKDEMNSLISSSIFMFRLLLIMPIILCLIIFTVNPSFFLPLITTAIGRIIILAILVLYILYIIVVRKIMKVNM